MKRAKLTFNGILITVIIFSAIGLFVMVKLTNMADRTPVNSIHEIEGTDLSIRYSSLKPDGIYKGDENTGVLVTEGTFGFDWGCVKTDDCLYLNEYSATDMGIISCNVVKVDLNSFNKEVLFKDTLIRGRCKSGELVCVRNYILPSNFPETNSLCKLYYMSCDSTLSAVGGTVVYINPENLETVYSVDDSSDLSNGFEEKYLEHSLEEVRK